MFTGQLVHHQGSLARAALPSVVHLHWGWHRVERAMERGTVSLDALFDRAFKRPLVISTTARELTTAAIRIAYGHRWPVETNFYVAQGDVCHGDVTGVE